MNMNRIRCETCKFWLPSKEDKGMGGCFNEIVRDEGIYKYFQKTAAGFKCKEYLVKPVEQDKVRVEI